MEKVLGISLRVSKLVLNAIGCTALALMMLLTVIDVFLRAAGRPIVGTYEIVALLLALVIGFCFPCVSLDRGNVYMEIVLDRLSKRNRAILNTFTRILGIVVFAVVAVDLFILGREFHMAGEVTSTLRLPFYPVAYGVGVCCFIQCLVLIFHIVQIWRGHYE